MPSFHSPLGFETSPPLSSPTSKQSDCPCYSTTIPHAIAWHNAKRASSSSSSPPDTRQSILNFDLAEVSLRFVVAGWGSGTAPRCCCGVCQFGSVVKECVIARVCLDHSCVTCGWAETVISG
ncbi:hypothetical protein NPIL_452811 [Nephila pilipes]|uniref:Uncharacterized protein n=1 Tax=Nephila pilipes TaxID=299642 RepID=A0A8X6UW44_NEPPI|nr:hypothetical protein NPIL_452811 [Nephila pilipes]